MHPDDAKSRAAGIFCFAGGAALTWWTDLLYTALPFAMLLVWFLPSRVFGAPEAAAAPPAAPVAGPTNEPIEPK